MDDPRCVSGALKLHFFLRRTLRFLAGKIAVSVLESLQGPFNDIEEKVAKHATEIDLAAQAEQMRAQKEQTRVISDGMCRI